MIFQGALTQVLIGGGLDQATATIFGLQYGRARQATADDLLLLTSSGAIGQLNEGRLAQLLAFGVPAADAAQLSINGVTYPMEDQWVLTPAEQSAVAAAQASYNSTIQALAGLNDLAYVDARAALQQVAGGGVPFDGGVVTSTFVTGGGFSLDGVHPSPRGYALTANAIIEAINAKYGSTVPNVNIGQYDTVTISND